MKPPTLQPIPANLLAGMPGAAASIEVATSDPQALLDYAQILIGGEEIVFAMDVPSIPDIKTPIVLTQAAASTAPPMADFVFKACTETQPTPDNPHSAMRGVDPAGMLEVYYLSIGKKVDIAKIKTTPLQIPKHGNLTSEVDNTGLTSYRYDPAPGFLGDDQAIFMAEYGGKHYKIILNIKVLQTIDEKSPICSDSKLIKIKKQPSGSSGYNLNSMTVSFTDLLSTAVGQTTGQSILLSNNAAGYNWFTDATPWFNEEYLPTSKPN